MKRLLLLVPLAGCPHGGTTPRVAAGDAYAGLFEVQRSWTYEVEDSEGSSYEVSCQVTDERDWPDGKVSVITCDGAFGDGVGAAVDGTWAADARGVWYLPDLVVDDLADTTGLPRDEMTPERMVLAAKPTEPCGAYGATRVCFAGGGVTSGELDDGAGHHVTFVEASEATEPEE